MSAATPHPCDRCAGTGLIRVPTADCWWCHGTEAEGPDPCPHCRPEVQPCDACEVARG